MGQIFSNKVANNTSGYLSENSFPSSSLDTPILSLPCPSYTKFWVENETSFCRIHYERETKSAGVRGGEKHFLIVHLNLLVIDNKLTRQCAHASPFFLKNLASWKLFGLLYSTCCLFKF